MSRPVCPVTRPLDCAPTEPALLAHRISFASRSRQGIAPAARYGMGNRKHPSRHQKCPQVDPHPHAKTESKVAAPGRRRNGERSPRGLERLEKKWLSIKDRFYKR